MPLNLNIILYLSNLRLLLHYRGLLVLVQLRKFMSQFQLLSLVEGNLFNCGLDSFRMVIDLRVLAVVVAVLVGGGAVVAF